MMYLQNQDLKFARRASVFLEALCAMQVPEDAVLST